MANFLAPEYAPQATISPCGNYRYTLYRNWDITRSRLCWIMLNPSTADHQKDDPTIRSCVRISTAWGYGSLSVVNLFAYRATKPRDLLNVKNPIGPSNDFYIYDELQTSRGVVVAWGASGPGSAALRIERVMRMLRKLSIKPYCLGITDSGMPKHPLFIRSDVKPIPYLGSGTCKVLKD